MDDIMRLCVLPTTRKVSFPAYILVIETTETICLEGEFFTSAAEAKKGKDTF